MKKENRKNDDPNCIEEEVRKVFGYDEESLLAEMEEAERAWEAEKAANPEAAASVQRQADEGFEQLMARIREKGIQPVSEDEYKAAEENDRVVLHEVQPKRRKKKMLLLVAAVLVLGLGTTMVVSARREYKVRTYPIQGQQNKVIKRSDTLVAKVGKINEAYQEIDDALDVKVLMLGYIPKEMIFKQLIVHDDHAIIEWEFDGKSIYFKESKVPIQSGFTGAVVSDRKVCDEVQNVWLDKKIAIEENILDNGLIEYSANIDMDDYYYFSGIVGKEEFIKMVEAICYK